MVLVGIDVGGTFTDLTAIDEPSGRVMITKVASRPGREADAVRHGLDVLGIVGRTVHRLVHGTTVGTNAILERRGARVAVLTTAGFRDLIEIGRTKRNIPALFVPTFIRPKPLVPRALRFEIAERMAADGSALESLSEADVERALDDVAAAGAEAVAVCLLHAYANPMHERAVAEALKGRLPALPASLSSDVVPEYREFERFSTTVLNAYLQPLMDRYLGTLEEELLKAGYAQGVLTVGSSGGVMTTETARHLPIKTIYSGPAGGVSQACLLAETTGVGDLITYDMGGTSTDVCLVKDRMPVTTTDNFIGAFPVKVPQIDIRTVGAGGGSVAWLDIDGTLEVGPRSAGARPGPAAYGLGGTEATVTDANVVLGRMGTRRSLGGTVRLARELAERAIGELALRLGPDAHATADGIIRIAVARMTSSIREISIQRGHDPRDFTLVAFGGAGPMHAIPVAAELGITRILIPRYAGNFSALGVMASDIKHDDVRTRLGPLGDRLGVIDAAFMEMENTATRQLASEGFRPEARRLYRSLDLRYRSQAFELNVPVIAGTINATDITQDFYRRHLEAYGYADPDGAVELVNVRLTAFGLVPKPAPSDYRSSARTLGDALTETRDVWFGGDPVPSPVYDRERLPEKAQLAGPAIVEEFGATTVIFPRWRAVSDPWGHLILSPET